MHIATKIDVQRRFINYVNNYKLNVKVMNNEYVDTINTEREAKLEKRTNELMAKLTKNVWSTPEEPAVIQLSPDKNVDLETEPRDKTPQDELVDLYLLRRRVYTTLEMSRHDAMQNINKLIKDYGLTETVEFLLSPMHHIDEKFNVELECRYTLPS